MWVLEAVSRVGNGQDGKMACVDWRSGFSGDRTFPRPYCVRASPFSWGGLPKPLFPTAPGRSRLITPLVPRELQPLNCLRPATIRAAPVTTNPPVLALRSSHPRIRHGGAMGFSTD
jgi:hypothetical protein